MVCREALSRGRCYHSARVLLDGCRDPGPRKISTTCALEFAQGCGKDSGDDLSFAQKPLDRVIVTDA